MGDFCSFNISDSKLAQVFDSQFDSLQGLQESGEGGSDRRNIREIDVEKMDLNGTLQYVFKYICMYVCMYVCTV